MNKLAKNVIYVSFLTFTLSSCSTQVSEFFQPSANQPNPHAEAAKRGVVVTEAAPQTKMALMSGAPVENTGSIGGNIHSTMDSTDKTKMSRGLDNGLGKSTNWVNARTNMQYSVTPTATATIKGNPFCRKYSLTATKGDNTRNYSGVACLESDGEWHPAT